MLHVAEKDYLKETRERPFRTSFKKPSFLLKKIIISESSSRHLLKRKRQSRVELTAEFSRLDQEKSLKGTFFMIIRGSYDRGKLTFDQLAANKNKLAHFVRKRWPDSRLSVTTSIVSKKMHKLIGAAKQKKSSKYFGCVVHVVEQYTTGFEGPRSNTQRLCTSSFLFWSTWNPNYIPRPKMATFLNTHIVILLKNQFMLLRKLWCLSVLNLELGFDSKRANLHHIVWLCSPKEFFNIGLYYPATIKWGHRFNNTISSNVSALPSENIVTSKH